MLFDDEKLGGRSAAALSLKGPSDDVDGRLEPGDLWWCSMDELDERAEDCLSNDNETCIGGGWYADVWETCEGFDGGR